MGLVGILMLLGMTLVAVEFGLHIVYHWKTGKAGLYDAPFKYLKSIDRIWKE